MLQALGAERDPLPLYQRALALDQARVDREPGRGLWRLDLSFSHASISAYQAERGDLPGAIQSPERAIALRQDVVTSHPDDDFARVSLARGYDRMAALRGEAGDVRGAIDASLQRVAIYRRRLVTHPGRATLWHDYVEAAVDAVRKSVELVAADGRPLPVRRAAASRIHAMLADLIGVLERPAAEKPADLPRPADDRISALRERVSRLR